jgi:hypothetical protein
MSRTSDHPILRRFHCERKKVYLSEMEAILAVGQMRALTGDVLQAYRCRFGPHYHIGHRPLNRNGAWKRRYRARQQRGVV